MNAQSEIPTVLPAMVKSGMRRLFMTQIRPACLSAVTSVCFATAGQAADLQPIQAHSVLLNEMPGVVYYTVETEGFRVVATLGGTADALPVRFIATLAPEQAVVLSVPREWGQPDAELRLVRHGDRLQVSDLRVAAR